MRSGSIAAVFLVWTLASLAFVTGCSSDVPNEVQYRAESGEDEEDDRQRGPTLRSDGLPFDVRERARTVEGTVLDGAERTRRQIEASGG